MYRYNNCFEGHLTGRWKNKKSGVDLVPVFDNKRNTIS